ncbi:hypothetical protein FHU13_003192 [Methylobacterium sp. R2-1]|nr:hypothetical protein [Methylobacterium sp. R2-1]
MTMTREGEDRAEGFAGESVAGSPGHPSLSSPDHAEAGDGSPSHRSLSGGTPPRPGTDGEMSGSCEAGGNGSTDRPSSGR